MRKTPSEERTESTKELRAGGVALWRAILADPKLGRGRAGRPGWASGGEGRAGLALVPLVNARAALANVSPPSAAKRIDLFGARESIARGGRMCQEFPWD